MLLKDIIRLKEWFVSQQRDLPWRSNPTPYSVWVSEIMLQQTQVSVVIPYFERWMHRFPSIQHLAKASLDEVLKVWEGLGYYSRARNLHAGAQYVVEAYGGQLPSSFESLSKIKGLGPYTIGAILSFAFHQRMAAVDGNVLRVLARYYACKEDITRSKTIKQIQIMAQKLLPEEEPWVISEALIELGATVCGRSPKCMQCPLRQGCAAHLEGIAHQLPVKAPRVATTQLYRAVAIIICEDSVLVQRGEKGNVMADLYQFPYIELTTSTVTEHEMKKSIEATWGLTTLWKSELPVVKHSFTRYRALLLPHMFEMKSPKEVMGYEWHSLTALKEMPFSAGHRRILERLKQKAKV